MTFGHVFFEIRVQTDRHRVYKYTDIDMLIATVCSSQLFREQSNCRNNILDITDVEIFNSVLIFLPERLHANAGTSYGPVSARLSVRRPSGKRGPKDQVALAYTSPSHWCTTHEVSKL